VSGHHRFVAGRRRARQRALTRSAEQRTAKQALPEHPNAIIRAVQRAYSASTRLLSAALLVVGLAMVVSTVARGGGALAIGVVFGTMLALIGAARLWLARSGPR
jgi:predicted anti-sigma-YlaC factor YlaD